MNLRLAQPLNQSPFVPAEAGTQGPRIRLENWVPASAGTNGVERRFNSAHLAPMRQSPNAMSFSAPVPPPADQEAKSLKGREHDEALGQRSHLVLVQIPRRSLGREGEYANRQDRDHKPQRHALEVGAPEHG